jgi:hypothetical protein
MIAEPLEKGLAEDIENEVVQITWNRYWTHTHNCTPPIHKNVHVSVSQPKQTPVLTIP